MAEGLNKVILIGNLGADPELKYTQGGSAVLRLRLATSESYVNKAGERQQRTEWHTVILWGKRAEALNNILSKGRSICVEGRIQYRQWEDKEGQKRNSTEINANNVVLLGGRREGGGYSDSSAPDAMSLPDEDDFGGDDIPF
ncbi:MAG: single-stranded DNA-binding protein [Polyangiales bacterium]